jgi:hypothetical protein
VTDMRDELLERVVDELRELPPVDEAAVGRIVRAAAADVGEPRLSAGARSVPPAFGGDPRGARLATAARTWWRSQVPLAAAAGLALAAGLAGYAIRGDGSRTPTGAELPTAAAPATGATAMLVSADRATRTADRTVATQFVLDSPRAARVSLVGDFNGWDPEATPLVRDSSSGIWTATVPLLPGRHVYAFMVDGTAWTLDPRAPTAQDPDFGTPSSVVLVGTP